MKLDLRRKVERCVERGVGEQIGLIEVMIQTLWFEPFPSPQLQIRQLQS